MTLTDTEWQARIAVERLNTRRWAVHTQLLIDQARSTPARQMREDYPSFLFWMEQIAGRPAQLSPELLSAFFTELGRLAGNLGKPSGDTDVERALDRAIEVQRRLGGDVVDLYLAKAGYLASQTTESPQRSQAIDNAVRESQPASTSRANAMVTLAAYQIEISRYDDAVRTARAIGRELPADLFHDKFRCAALLQEGVALFTSFQDIARAQVVLEQACEYADRADSQVTRWLATAYHFLARIAEVQQRYRDAVDLYIVGQEYQNRCLEEVGADAFIHLRIAEPLIASGLLDDARQHLEEARRLVRTGSNISSARLQVELGFATLAAADGQLGDAEATALEALRSAREVAFWRGELLCLGYLLVLAVKRRRPDKMLLVAVNILRTAVFGELRRNKLTRLLLRIPVVLPIAIRRMSRRPRPGSVAQTVLACPCVLHNRPVTEVQLDAVHR